MKTKEILSGWGLFPKLSVYKTKPRSIYELKKELASSSVIARGNGRSYGDSSINKSNTILMSYFNRFCYFDSKKGFLIAQSGVLLEDVINTFLPKGWFPYVTPGTKFVTLGGIVATNVHGKNHHNKGCFGNYVKWLEILNSEGKIIRCSREENCDLFDWTLGGMGLTGIILKVAFYLQPVKTAWIKQKTLVARNIDHLIDLFEKNINSTYAVGWIDCYARGSNLGRSLLMLGENAKIKDLNSHYQLSPLITKKKRKISIPFYFPSFILNNLSVKIFNSIYFLKGVFFNKNKMVDWDTYFYPLDNINNWNKIYGMRGFAQFQCVIPLKNSRKGMSELLDTIAKSKSSSFLAVIKRFGKQESRFSFPMEGYSLALDFPINKRNLLLINILDEITIKNGGRFYLAKDSRLNRNILKKSDKRVQDYKAYRKCFPNLKFSSFQSDRLDL